MKCARCQEELGEDRFDYYGETVCEDCYIAAVQPPRPCDPAAVSSAVHTRRQLGQTGTQGLTELQKKIYEYVKENGKVEREKLPKILNLEPHEMEIQLAILRHCELIKASKEGGTIFVTIF